MLKTYTLEDCEKWDQIVRSFSDYDVYYLSGYVKAFQLHGDGTPVLFYYEDGDVKGINVVMKRDIARDEHFAERLPENTYFDFSTPYGYGGWLIENPKNKDTSSLFKKYCEHCRKYHIVCEFVRFHPLIKNHQEASSYYEVIPMGEVVAISLISPEAIWENFISQNRNKIRKSQKGDVRIFHSRSPEIYEVFHKIYDHTMEKDHAVDYYYFEREFYESVLMDLPENAQVFYSRLPDGSVIAASIILMANGRMNYHLSGSLKEYNSLAPVNLLLYKAALWGCANGCKTLYLGGGVGSEEDSLLTFKKSFNKKETERFYIGKKIFDMDMYQKLVDMRQEEIAMIRETSYFPAYRVKN